MSCFKEWMLINSWLNGKSSSYLYHGPNFMVTSLRKNFLAEVEAQEKLYL